IGEPFERVEVDVNAGRIVIEAAPDGSASLTAETEAALTSSAEVTHEVVDGRLIVSGDCNRGIWLVGGFQCRTSVTLQVPADVEVVAKSSAGSVSIAGLTGAADIESSAGSVRVNNHTGPLRAHSSAGGVEVSGLQTDDAEITSSAGGVDVEATTPPRNLVVSSSAGGVTVTLPGGQAYNLTAETSAGSTNVEVPTDPDSPYRVEARSSAGGVTVRTGAG